MFEVGPGIQNPRDVKIMIMNPWIIHVAWIEYVDRLKIASW